MITLYWAFEYTKVLLAYLFLMFVWPSTVFFEVLKGRSKTFWFGFCVTVQVVLVNSVVLLLGLLHILNPWVIRILFYGVFIWSACRNIRIKDKQKQDFKHLVMGTYGRKSYIADRLNSIGRFIRYLFCKFCDFMRGHWWDYGILFVILIYGMVYFTYGAFQDYSYGFGDMYPHSAWVYGLTQGKIFSAGVYPEAMHCFVYGMHTLFGIRLYSCMLFLAGIHVMVYLLSAYLLFKELFRSRYTPLFVLTAFLTVDLLCIDEVYSMSRLQWTLPQEFGLYTLFLCGTFLIRYSRSTKQIPEIYLKPFTRIRDYYNQKERQKIAAMIPEFSLEEELNQEIKYTENYWDENLFVFAMALAASLTIHFYPTIMAFFLCVALLPIMAFRIFYKKRLIPLVVAVALGCLVAVVPMVGALISGIPFQGSIGWAVNVINGEDEANNPNIILDEETGEEITGSLSFSWGGGSSSSSGEAQESSDNESESGSSSEGGQQAQQTPPQKEKEPLLQRIKGLIQRKADALYWSGYVTLYREQRADFIVNCTFLAFALWAAVKAVLLIAGIFLRSRKTKRTMEWDAGYFDGYFSIALASVLFMMLYCAGSLGLPSLIAGSRICSSAQMLILAVLAIPVDLFLTLAQVIVHHKILGAVSALGTLGIYVGTIMTGTFHGYLYYELTRYNSAVMTTYSIVSSMPKGTYTIVSPTDEIYQMIQYGWHEELTDFMNSTRTIGYVIPTEHVFIYVEKKPIEYAQSHFFEGSDWLAWEKYADYYVNFVSQCPDITASEISAQEAELRWFAGSSGTYDNIAMRTLLESQAYRWCQKFREIYPYEMRVYYEDEDFVCYYFRQNPENLFLLNIW
ncbi:MAG: hypothetical protein NC094_09865 [Bacteroidales bacterium]|nr:hypothetical protein [Lachnoclostridium sp.]MCM1383632.1 hypothetical protein [Lachnoclostridium sp.]MCM1465714.1 hypothetical protein [Bacteroidales bacterium]